MNAGPPSSETSSIARAFPLLLVAAACLFNLVAYLTEVAVAAPDINDDVFHFGLIQRMNAAWDAGGWPLDTWIGYWGQGFPVLRYYQHLPHLVVVLAYRLLGGQVALHSVFEGFMLLLLAAMPLTFYLGSRWLGATRTTAAFVALCTPLLGADPSQQHYLGFQPQSFLWSGGGLFTQLMAIVLFPLALGATSRAALQGHRYAPAIALLGATWLSHLVLGYIACLLGVAALLRPEARGMRVRVTWRLGLVYAGVALLASYLLLPTLLEGQWLSRSMWEPPQYWHSYGALHVLAALASGGLLDGDRIAVLTILAGTGALLAGRAVLRRQARPDDGFAIAALAMFVLGLLLYFGRPTWGHALDLLPFSGSLPLHRFICAVQFGGLLLAALTLSRIADWLARWRPAAAPVAAGATALLLLSPAIASTVTLARRNADWRADAAAADAIARPALEPAFARFQSLDRTKPGRGYAGTSWNWGRDFKRGGANVYHRWSAWDLPAISYMYHTMGLASDLEPDFDAARRDHYELFNVRFLLADHDWRLPAFAARLPAAPGLAAGLVDTQGFFGVVGSVGFVRFRPGQADALRLWNRAFIAGDRHAAGAFIRIGWRDGDAAAAGETTLPIDQPRDLSPPPGWQAPRGQVIVSSGGGDHYRARVRMDDAGLILFRMAFHPHWRAALDGQPAETLMLTPGYLGVRAGPGDHELVMRYAPPRWTRVPGWAGLALLALVAVGDARRRRRPA